MAEEKSSDLLNTSEGKFEIALLALAPITAVAMFFGMAYDCVMRRRTRKVHPSGWYLFSSFILLYYTIFILFSSFILLSIIMVEVSAIKSSNQKYFQEDFVSVVRFLVGKRPILTSKIGNFV